MLKYNIIAAVLYILISLCFLETSVECSSFIGPKTIGIFLIFMLFIIFFLNSLAFFIENIKKNILKNLLNLIFQPLLVIFCIFLSLHAIDFINNLNLKSKYDAMFKFRRMDWDGKITCKNNICDVPAELTSKLGKYVAKDGYQYIFTKPSIGGYNAFVIGNDYNSMYENHSCFNKTFSSSVYMIDYNIKPTEDKITKYKFKVRK